RRQPGAHRRRDARRGFADRRSRPLCRPAPSRPDATRRRARRRLSRLRALRDRRRMGFRRDPRAPVPSPPLRRARPVGALARGARTCLPLADGGRVGAVGCGTRPSDREGARLSAFSKTLEIRWRDIDALGHVNNAVYLAYLEELLTSWLRPAIGDDWVNARVELDFRREFRLADGQVIARGELLRVGNSSLTARVWFERPDGEV